MKNKNIFLTVCGIILLTLVIFPYGRYIWSQADQEIKMYIGQDSTIAVSNPTRVVISNPAIADVKSVTVSEIILTPKSAGNTTFMFWDNFGEQNYKIKVFAEDVNEIKRRVDNIISKLNLPEVYTQAEEDEGKVFLVGRVKSPQDKETIKTTLGALFQKTVDLIKVKEEESVVEIDVLVFEISKDAENVLGLTWPNTITFTEPAGRWTTLANVPDAIFRIANWNQATGSTATQLSMTIDALSAQGKAEILSRPRLACQSGKEAELLVGGEKPVFTTNVASAGGEGTSVEYKEYGIKLNIKPIVTDDKRIKLGVKVEVSETGNAETIGSTAAPTAKAYPLTKRNTSTELFLDDGQTLAIGGLIKRKDETDTTNVPFFGDIPILGAAFRHKSKKEGGGRGSKGNTELFITLTPKIVAEDRTSNPRPRLVEAKPSEGAKTESASASSQKTDYKIPSGPVAEYANIVQGRILENIAYPDEAKKAGFQGTIVLGLRLSYTGQLLDAQIKKSSGYNALDDYTISAVNNIASYPPFPPSVDQDEVFVEIPITYRLD